MISWTNENIPLNSRILLYEADYTLELGIRTSCFAKFYYIEEIFKEEYNQTELFNEIDYLKKNNIKYLLISEDYLSDDSNIVDFIETTLEPNFYNDSLYESGDLELYYAPYFDE